MYCETLHRDGELLVSIEWFCRFLFDLNVSICNDVVYVTDHFAELSAFMAQFNGIFRAEYLGQEPQADTQIFAPHHLTALQAMIFQLLP